jgi:hypothetical protein
MGVSVVVMTRPGGGGAGEDGDRDGLNRPGELCRPEGWDDIALVLVLLGCGPSRRMVDVRRCA